MDSHRLLFSLRRLGPVAGAFIFWGRRLSIFWRLLQKIQTAAPEPLGPRRLIETFCFASFCSLTCEKWKVLVVELAARRSSANRPLAAAAADDDNHRAALESGPRAGR